MRKYRTTSRTQLYRADGCSSRCFLSSKNRTIFPEIPLGFHNWVDTCQTTLKLQFSARSHSISTALHFAKNNFKHPHGYGSKILEEAVNPGYDEFRIFFWYPNFDPVLPHHHRSPTWSCITSTRAGALTARRKGADALDSGACRRCRWELGASKPDASTAGLRYDLCIYMSIWVWIYIYI